MNDLGARIDEFVGTNKAYYRREFTKIHNARQSTTVWSWNSSAALAGSFWAAYRRLWGVYWLFLMLELFALVQVGRGIWGTAGGDKLIRHQQIVANIAKRQQQLAEAQAGGNQQSVATASKIIDNLKQVAAQLEQQIAQESTTPLLIVGLILLLAIKIFAGFYANFAYQKKYRRWRITPQREQHGAQFNSLAIGLALAFAIWPLTLFRFIALSPDKLLASWSGGWLGESLTISEFPLGRDFLFNAGARWGDAIFVWATKNFSEIFDGIIRLVVMLLDGLEIILIATPWPVVMLLLVVLAFRLAGYRVAIFTGASLAYLAVLGLWEISMTTVALIGAGAGICVLLGIPIGIWFGRNPRAYSFAEPVLDFMQTMPTFVYLIPVIAFFGTGKPPGVLVTIIFAIPPVIRLTVLGIRNVPEPTKEAAIAFGCSSWQLLWKVQLPLATPSIMTGVNQTILMSLSMVVIASLIGAEGLGALILEALQYAAKGQGLLAGVAILLCAMVMDRIAQGVFAHRKHRAVSGRR